MLLVLVFVVGYLAIALEQWLKLNKAAAALLTGVICWTVFVLRADPAAVNEALAHHLGGIAQVLFFLLAAMTIVELIDVHDGFELLTSRVRTTHRRRLLVTITVVAFFLSAVLDNLTTAILMMSLIRRLVADDEDRTIYGGVVVLAANAGGVWSPIGDVTTTMLWVGEQITTIRTVTWLFLPALMSIVVPALWLALRLKGHVRPPVARRRVLTPRAELTGASEPPADAGTHDPATTTLTLPTDAYAADKTLAEIDLRGRTGVWVTSLARGGGPATAPSPIEPLREGDVLALGGPPEAVALALELLLDGVGPRPTTPRDQRIVLAVGLGALLFVPVFKTLTQLPPVLGILLGLGVLWIVTELLHKRKNDERRNGLSVAAALQRVDSQSVLFFLGILLAIGALEASGLLHELARAMDAAIGSVHLITLAIGVASSIVDNVPLVAAAQGMYPRSTFPTDHSFWLFLAYCAGTGGSILIIGSAAGVAVMGIQRISFGWYVRRLSLPALLGYAAGAGVYVAIEALGG